MTSIMTGATLAVIVPLLTLSGVSGWNQTANEEKRNAEVIRLATEAMNRHDVEAYVAYWAEDTKNFDRPVGREGIRRAIEDIFTTFPDYRHDVIEVIAKDDSVVVRCTTSGTHRGVGKLALNGGMLVGVEPTHKRFAVQHIHWYKLRDGKIVAHTANRDDLGMMRQLGLLKSQVETAEPIAEQRPPVKCTEDSPERRGAEGCTILASRPLHGSLVKPVYWHIDRFDSLEAAKRATGPDGVAAEAHGSVWLMTVEARTEEHYGGQHVAWIGPLALPTADRYTMRVQSSLLRPGAATPVHTHSGPEVFYVVDGEQCLETQEVGHRLGAGQTLVLPAGVIHRGRVIGSGGRRALALIVHDAARPASHDLAAPPPLAPCK